MEFKHHILKGLTAALLSLAAVSASAQKYPNGIIDKSIAVVGNERGSADDEGAGNDVRQEHAL